jgi:ubiquinone/menaquinone biosynthesis C-methylase UbiE
MVNGNNTQNATRNTDDLLWRQLKSLPAFRALLRAVEARFYRAIDIPEPILDLGCGDGDFTGVIFDEPITAGIDPWWNPLQKSRRGGNYRLLTQAMGDKMPFPDESFASVISNSVLEHIPDIQPVLNEASRVLKTGGKLVITMPSDNFTKMLGGAAAFERIGLGGMADSYRNFFNGISRHAHTDAPQVWAERLAQAGFAIVRWQQYFSQDALRALEVGHAQGVPSAVLHALTGHWIVAPYERSLQVTEQWLRPLYEEPFPEQGAYIFFVAQKVKHGPIAVHLPEERQFTLEELAASREPLAVSEEGWADSREPLAVSEELAIGYEPLEWADSREPLAVSEDMSSQPPAANRQPLAASRQSPLITLGFVALAVMAALVGQGVMSRDPGVPGAGLFWWGVSLVALAILSARQVGLFQMDGSLPRLVDVPPRRWLLALALALTLTAQGTSSPTMAFLSWFAAAGVAVYALWLVDSEEPLAVSREPLAAGTDQSLAIAQDAPRTTHHASRLELGLIITLTLLALVFRLVNLTGHPFIMNGTEANIGLDVLAVSRGNILSPFASGWISNPTLPSFLLSLPVGLLGPSLLSMRILSTLVGACTVLAVALLGRRLYGATVGLVAAAFLTGWHLHLHYSRLGVTNIWDPLLVMLALGLLALAWQENRRSLWLAAGGSLGLCAYFYTSSHLIPLMMVGLVVVWFVANRGELWARRHGLLAAAALAIIIALPQYLYYRATPAVFMERVNQYGILQTGWLMNQAAATGQTPLAVLGGQVWRGLLAFNAGLDSSNLYGVTTPFIRSLWAAFYLLGIGLALFKWRQVKYQILLVWLGVTLLFAAALMDSPPASHRILIATPAVVLLTALALVWLVELVSEQLAVGGGKMAAHHEPLADSEEMPAASSQPPAARFTPAAATLILLVLIGFIFSLNDVLYYFNGYRQENRFGDRNTELAYAVSTYVNSFDEGQFVYFYGPPAVYTSFPTFPFLLREVTPGIDFVDVAEGEQVLNAAAANLIFIYLPERFTEHSQVVARFPGGDLQTFSGTFADPLFYAYAVTAP